MYPTNKPRLFADGGMPGQAAAPPMPAQQAQPPMPGGGDPNAMPGDPNQQQPPGDPALDQIDQGLQAFVQTRDPNTAMQVCDQLAQLRGISDPQGGQGGDPNDPNNPGAGGQPMGGQGIAMPTYKRGGALPVKKKPMGKGGKSALDQWNAKKC